MNFKERYGYWSPNSWSKNAIFGTKPTPQQRTEYLKYLQVIAQRKEKPLEWVQKHMELEFSLKSRWAESNIRWLCLKPLQ